MHSPENVSSYLAPLLGLLSLFLLSHIIHLCCIGTLRIKRHLKEILNLKINCIERDCTGRGHALDMPVPSPCYLSIGI